MFTQMRALHAIQRMRAVNAAYGTGQRPHRITTRDVLDFATLQGSRTNSLAAVTGSLTPGEKADLLVIQAEDLNNMPLNDPIGTVVLGSDARNIRAVLINGEPRKWNGHVLDVDLSALRREVGASREYVLNTRLREHPPSSSPALGLSPEGMVAGVTRFPVRGWLSYGLECVSRTWGSGSGRFGERTAQGWARMGSGASARPAVRLIRRSCSSRALRRAGRRPSAPGAWCGPSALLMPSTIGSSTVCGAV